MSKASLHRRPVLRAFAILCLLGGLGVLLFGGGYLAHRFEVNPVYSFLNRAENKLRKIAGEPPELDRRMRQIDTTFLQLKGTVYPQPGRDYVNGGALTVWGDLLLAMNWQGRIFILDEEGGRLRRTPIKQPDNGLADYRAVAKTEKYAGYQHTFNKVRFNDIQHVDSGDLYGLVLSYTFFDGDHECYGTRISWLPLPRNITHPREIDNAAGDWKTVFDTYPCEPLNDEGVALSGITAGGRLAFQAPSKLYLGSGDYELDGIRTYDAGIQSDDTTFGKVVQIDLRDGSHEIISKGHRNMQGVAIDTAGRLWVAEHGIRGGDELNHIEDGQNYGWPFETLGTLYSGLPAPIEGEYGRHQIHRAPAYAWLPSVGVSALTAIDGIDPAWDGDLLAGSLSSEKFGQSLYRIRPNADGRSVQFVERIQLGVRVRYVTQFGTDRLAIWTDLNEVVVFKTSRRADPLARTRQLVKTEYPADLALQVEQTLDSCNQCHSFAQYANDGAPSLNGVVGRDIAITRFEDYSDALRSVSGTWTPDLLKAYLKNPEAVAPGGSMPNPGLTDETLINALIWALSQIDSESQEHLTYN